MPNPKTNNIDTTRPSNEPSCDSPKESTLEYVAKPDELLEGNGGVYFPCQFFEDSDNSYSGDRVKLMEINNNSVFRASSNTQEEGNEASRLFNAICPRNVYVSDPNNLLLYYLGANGILIPNATLIKYNYTDNQYFENGPKNAAVSRDLVAEKAAKRFQDFDLLRTCCPSLKRVYVRRYENEEALRKKRRDNDSVNVGNLRKSQYPTAPESIPRFINSVNGDYFYVLCPCSSSAPDKRYLHILAIGELILTIKSKGKHKNMKNFVDDCENILAASNKNFALYDTMGNTTEICICKDIFPRGEAAANIALQLTVDLGGVSNTLMIDPLDTIETEKSSFYKLPILIE